MHHRNYSRTNRSIDTDENRGNETSRKTETYIHTCTKL